MSEKLTGGVSRVEQQGLETRSEVSKMQTHVMALQSVFH